LVCRSKVFHLTKKEKSLEKHSGKMGADFVIRALVKAASFQATLPIAFLLS